MKQQGLLVLQVFPEIEQLGQSTVQQICNRWLDTPIAREFAISRITIHDVEGRLSLDFEARLNHSVSDGEDYYFPMDELLAFIADQLDPETRTKLKVKIQTKRQPAGPDVYRRFTLALGPLLPLFVTCKTCDNVMQTDLTAHRSESTRFEPEEIECPHCGTVFTSDGTDFHFEPET